MSTLILHIVGSVFLVVGVFFLVMVALIKRNVKKEKENCYMSTNGYFIGKTNSSPVTDPSLIGDNGVFGVYSYNVNDKEYYLTKYDKYNSYDNDVIISYNPEMPSKAFIEGENDPILKITSIVFNIFGVTFSVIGSIVFVISFLI